MKTIYKYPFEMVDSFNINVSKDAEVLTVQVQNHQPCIWVLTNPNAELVPKRFTIYGTGHDINTECKNMKYIGTFQLHHGTFIGHLFEHI